ncbi:MAG: ferredoxin [Patescibacteria group bacterium]|nr:ferredoxin [Patescibacteria group bacterium]
MKVDQKKCIGCGACASLYPDNFKINKDGKAEPIVGSDNSDAADVIGICPVSAISNE